MGLNYGNIFIFLFNPTNKKLSDCCCLFFVLIFMYIFFSLYGYFCVNVYKHMIQFSFTFTFTDYITLFVHYLQCHLLQLRPHLPGRDTNSRPPNLLMFTLFAELMEFQFKKLITRRVKKNLTQNFNKNAIRSPLLVEISRNPHLFL